VQAVCGVKMFYTSKKYHVMRKNIDYQNSVLIQPGYDCLFVKARSSRF
jgi:hypothetical protein